MEAPAVIILDYRSRTREDECIDHEHATSRSSGRANKIGCRDRSAENDGARRRRSDGVFSMVVDGHFKTHFDNEEAAHTAGSMLIEAFPYLQIKIYDANTKTRAALK
jgi:hypothetical protein